MTVRLILSISGYCIDLSHQRAAAFPAIVEQEMRQLLAA
jgi:hypothetical protein